jgi:hypothetical protein
VQQAILESKKEEAKQTKSIREENEKKKMEYMEKVNYENKFKKQMRQ